ncbi:MAG: hypothetical protein JRE64_04370 [Deltaproteobacteria bacterium]|nr:hypothetical protein [Deltaproteobacteria bacterium]
MPEFAVDLIDLIEQNRFFAMLSKSFSISRVKSTLTLCIGDLISFHRRFSKFICGAYPAKFAGAWDQPDVVGLEAAAMELGRRAAIETADSRLWGLILTEII